MKWKTLEKTPLRGHLGEKFPNKEFSVGAVSWVGFSWELKIREIPSAQEKLWLWTKSRGCFGVFHRAVSARIIQIYWCRSQGPAGRTLESQQESSGKIPWSLFPVEFCWKSGEIQEKYPITKPRGCEGEYQSSWRAPATLISILILININLLIYRASRSQTQGEGDGKNQQTNPCWRFLTMDFFFLPPWLRQSREGVRPVQFNKSIDEFSPWHSGSESWANRKKALPEDFNKSL